MNKETPNMKKRTITTVLADELDNNGSDRPVWVECPDDYNPKLITADDIVMDDAIRRVDEPDCTDPDCETDCEWCYEHNCICPTTYYRVEETATGIVLWEGAADSEAAAWDVSLVAAGYTPGEPSLDADGKDMTERDDGIRITQVAS